MDIISRTKEQTKFIVFHPTRRGHILATIDSSGNLLKTVDTFDESSAVSVESNAWDCLISQIKRGVATDSAKSLICVRTAQSEKKQTTLGKLIGKAENRGSNSGLSVISAENRFKGTDWESKRPDIDRWTAAGRSITWMAKKLGVSQSTLSKANTRHGLYPKKNAVNMPDASHG